MKLAGMLLLLAGWAIVLCAVVLFPPSGMRGLFVVAGCAVEVLGLVLAFRGGPRLTREPLTREPLTREPLTREPN